MEIEFLGIFGNWFWSLINPIIWLIFIQGPLQLLNAFDEIFKYINGAIILDAIFGIPTTGDTHQFNPSQITPVFWAFFTVGLLVLALLFILNYITITFSEELDFKQRLVKSFKSAGLGILFTFLIPVGIFVTIGIVQIFTMAFSKIFTGQTGGGFAKMIYKLGDPNWDGSSVGDVPDDFSKPGNIGSYNIVVTIFLTWGMLYTVAMVGIATIQKTFEIFFQMLIGPIIAATMVQDDGIRMKSWKDTTLNKMMVLLATTLCYYLFLMIVTILVQRTPFQGIPKMLFMGLVILGGGVFIQVAPQAVSLYLGNESVSAAEGRSALASAKSATSMLTAGTAAVAGAAVGNKWLNNKMKKKNNLNQAMMGAKGLGTQTGGASASETAEAGQTAPKSPKTSMGGIFGFARKGLGKAGVGLVAGVGAVGAIKSLPKRTTLAVKDKVTGLKNKFGKATGNAWTGTKSKFLKGYSGVRTATNGKELDKSNPVKKIFNVNENGDSVLTKDIFLHGHQQNKVDYHTTKINDLEKKKQLLNKKFKNGDFENPSTKKEAKYFNKIQKISSQQDKQLVNINDLYHKSYSKQQKHQNKQQSKYSKQQSKYSKKNSN